MQDSIPESSQESTREDNHITPRGNNNAIPQGPGDRAARNAGLFLIATAAISLLSVLARVTADADQATLAESLTAISESRFIYGLGGVARLVSGLTLLGGALFLLATWIIRQRRATPLAPWLFGASGILTAVSGLCAVALALVAVAATNAADPTAFAEAAAYLRWLSGKLGFTAAGLALLVAARYQWMAGGALRAISPFSVIVGAAMLFIWLDALTLVHRFSGVAFVLWLVVMGFMLFTGRVERLFIATFGSPATGNE